MKNKTTCSHFETLSKYVFAQKIKAKNNGFYYQLYEIQNDEVIKINGGADGFRLCFLGGAQSNVVSTIINLYKAIRSEHDEMRAFKK